jgi:hypothetical protein
MRYHDAGRPGALSAGLMKAPGLDNPKSAQRQPHVVAYRSDAFPLVRRRFPQYSSRIMSASGLSRR